MKCLRLIWSFRHSRHPGGISSCAESAASSHPSFSPRASPINLTTQLLRELSLYCSSGALQCFSLFYTSRASYLSSPTARMSSSIAIPKRKKQQAVSEAPSPSSSSSYSSSADSPRTSQATSATSLPQTRYNHDRRPSLLSMSLTKLPSRQRRFEELLEALLRVSIPDQNPGLTRAPRLLHLEVRAHGYQRRTP